MFGVLCAHMKAVFIGPVLVYCCALACVLYKASSRSTAAASLLSVHMATIGATAFVMSDSTLAFTKFDHQFKNSGMMIMVTYYFAQIFLGASASCRVLLGEGRLGQYTFLVQYSEDSALTKRDDALLAPDVEAQESDSTQQPHVNRY